MAAGTSRHDAIALDDSTDDEAQPSDSIRSSTNATAPLAVQASTAATTGPQAPETPAQPTANPVFNIADRAAMERERLDRQRKRRREAGLPEDDSGETNGSDQGADAGRRRLENGESSNSRPTPKGQPPMYWRGAVLKSYNQYSSGEPGTRFEDFLRPTTPFRANGLKHAIMATYVEDIQWLSALFPKGKTAPPFTMITLSRDGLAPGVYSPLHPQLPNWTRLVVPRPSFSEYTTMHMKFLMLFYEDRLRLLILSGNLVEFDWSSIENTAFIHDFPRRSGTSSAAEPTNAYEQQMRKILASLSVPPGHSALQDLSLYDMSSQCEARLVVSLPTVAPITGWPNIEAVGIGRLASVAHEILGKRTPVTIETQGSSMGSYTPRWLQQVHIVCQGGAYNQHLPLPHGAKAQRAWSDATRCSEKEKWPPIKLLFPSERWVRTKAIEGPAGAGTFFGKSEQATKSGFIELLHEPESIRANVMMHHKAILALKEGSETSTVGESDADEVIGWVYGGSHNLTQAAWGNISKGSGNQVQMTCGNWELGIVVPVRRRDLALSQGKHAVDGSQSLAANTITWKRPVQHYRPGDVPWDMKVQS